MIKTYSCNSVFLLKFASETINKSQLNIKNKVMKSITVNSSRNTKRKSVKGLAFNFLKNVISTPQKNSNNFNV